MKTHELEEEMAEARQSESFHLRIPAGEVSLAGDLDIPEKAVGLVLFAHGSGSSRLSVRNQAVAEVLRGSGIATLLFDLLTPEEEAEDAYTGHLRFNIRLLSRRLALVTNEMADHPRCRSFSIGYFGASTGAAAALIAAAALPSRVDAVVSRGGRPDLAGEALRYVKAPTLLIVGERDRDVLWLNEKAYQQLECERSLTIVPHATHLFEEPGTLEGAARLAASWFTKHLKGKNDYAIQESNRGGSLSRHQTKRVCKSP
jgi:putative phosphoribosyl transferase